MALLEQVLGAYLTAALPALVIEPNGGHLGVLGELVDADIVDDVHFWDPEDVVDAEVVEDTPPAADQSDHALLERLAAYETRSRLCTRSRSRSSPSSAGGAPRSSPTRTTRP